MADPQTPNFEEQRDILREINAELGRQINNVRDASKEYASLESIARKLQNTEEGISNLNEKQLNDLYEKSRASVRDLRSAAERLKIEKGLTGLSEQELNNAVNLNEEQKSLLRGLRSNFALEEEFLGNVRNQVEAQKQINQQVGLTGKLLKGVNKIPVIGEFLNAEDALKAANDAAKDGAGKLGTMKAAAGSLGKSLLTNLVDPLTLAVSIGKGFLAADQQTGELAKNLGITFNEASKTRQEFAQIANFSMDSNVTVKGLQESLMAVNSELGTSANLSTEELETMTKLNKQAGISLETQSKLFTTAKATGQEYSEFVASFQGAAKAAKFQAGASINTKKLMTDMANVSNRTKLSIQGGADGLAKAAVSAKLMGGDLNKVAGIADQLLNFESSIENELSAELLLGKDINLEKARQAALNNDLATVAEEITKQAGSAAEFNHMNRIQQEAMANAVGMTADQLADTLVEQEALKAVGHDLNDEEKEAFEAAKAKYGVEKASQILKDKGIDQLLEEQTNQEKFAAITEKLQETFIQLGDALMPVFTMLGDIATTIMPAISFILAPLIEGFRLIGSLVGKFVKGLKEGQPIMVGIAGALTAMLAPTIMTAIFSIFSSFAKIPYGLGIPLAGAAIAGMISLASSSTSKVKSIKDGAIDPKGGLLVSGEKGSIQLDKEDSIIAGTNLGGKSKTSTENRGMDSSAVVTAIAELRRDINALANRPINISVQLDGKELATVQGKYPNEAGDANRVTSFTMS